MGVCRIYQGGPTIFFFGGGACDAWRSHAFARGVRGHASPKKKFLMVRFFTFKKSKNIIFIQK